MRPRPKKRRSKAVQKPKKYIATTDYEAQLWQMAYARRGNMDASEYSAQNVPNKEFEEFFRECDRLEYNVIDDRKFGHGMTTEEMRGVPST